MKSNDSLLHYMIDFDHKTQSKVPIHIKDCLAYNPDRIHVGANTRVYIHNIATQEPVHILSGVNNINITRDTNTIIRCDSDITFSSEANNTLTVQYIILYYHEKN